MMYVLSISKWIVNVDGEWRLIKMRRDGQVMIIIRSGNVVVQENYEELDKEL